MKRSDVVADAAIALLAERGMRGLTHRAVDEAAGLPPGSTSNLARTRAALLELTLARLTTLEWEVVAGAYESAYEGGRDLTALSALLAGALHLRLGDRVGMLARYELALEATRRPELRAIYDRAGRRFRDPAVAILAALGSQDPVRHGRTLVAFAEGLLFDAVAGAGTTPTREDLEQAVRELLTGMLGTDVTGNHSKPD
ncbi:DNA-binding transcriptional regulator YbjK [Nonomuraea maritima]|uniref:DNA-binding transcriptional regulator YbjK n=1 Tax=Nonomuraea maritima TaxID=683260 RepID=A0A1G9KAM4_9ACTN|nr:TetR/AcrR family transcriptional regulator [Nonomuraea maritima]SDL46771.1 DNA-binding transcriptional regulator YbjK [Nonomuraea maritima]